MAPKPPRQWRDLGPNMSDASLLVSVEDLINMAMGQDEQNTVNYKLVQMILHILARQMRMLETKVEVKIAEVPVPELPGTKKKKKRRSSSDRSSSDEADISPSHRKSKKEEAGLDRRASRKSQSKSPKDRQTGSPTKKDEDISDQRARAISVDFKKRGKDKDRDEGRSESPKEREKSTKQRKPSHKQTESDDEDKYEDESTTRKGEKTSSDSKKAKGKDEKSTSSESKKGKGKESQKNKSDSSILPPSEKVSREKKHKKMEELGELQDTYRVEPDQMENPVTRYRRPETVERKKRDDWDDFEKRRKHQKLIESLREQFVDQYIISESDEPDAQQKATTVKRKSDEMKKKDKAEADDGWATDDSWNSVDRVDLEARKRSRKSKYKSDGDEPDNKTLISELDKLKQLKAMKSYENKEKNNKKDTGPKTTTEKRKLGGFLYKKRVSARSDDEDGEAKSKHKSTASKEYDGIAPFTPDDTITKRKHRAKSAQVDSEKLEEDTNGRTRPKSAGEVDKMVIPTETDLEDDYKLISEERKAMKNDYPTDLAKGRKRRERIDSMDIMDSMNIMEDDNEGTPGKRRKTDKQDKKDRQDRTAEEFDRIIRSSESIDTDLETELKKERKKYSKRRDRVDSAKERRNSGEFDLDQEGDKNDRESETTGSTESSATRDRKKSAKKRDKADISEDSTEARKKSAKRKDKTGIEGASEQGSLDIIDLEESDGTKERKKSARRRQKEADKDGSQDRRASESVDSLLRAALKDDDLGADYKEREKSATQKDKRDKDKLLERGEAGTLDGADLENDDLNEEMKKQKKTDSQKDETDQGEIKEPRALKIVEPADLEDDDLKEESKKRKKSAKQRDKETGSGGTRDRAGDDDSISEQGKKKEKENLAQKGRRASGTGISIREEERGAKGQGKVLVVEKGPTTRSDSRTTKVGSIECVTVSQFDELEAEVRNLKKKAGPLPMPAMPDNKQLRKELAKGSATLGDTMQAMQVAARVEAAEKAITRMAGLLTQLAAAGALPDDVANQVEYFTQEMEAAASDIQAAKMQIGALSGTGTGSATDSKVGAWPLPLQSMGPPGRKSVAIDPTLVSTTGAGRDLKGIGARSSVLSRASIASSRTGKGNAYVTHNEFEDAMESLKDLFSKNLTSMTSKAANAAEAAAAIAKAVAEKMDIALKLDVRISTLHSMVSDYSEQLDGFDVGLTSQITAFQEQIVMIRGDLQQGLAMLASANNNAETAAVLELTERYESLVEELDHTLHVHAGLTQFQNQLGEELKSLAECVETLREQKADSEEVQDGLRDKADNSRLAELLTESRFAAARGELERRLDCCYDKFSRQEGVWMGAIKDLSGIAEQKAELMQLLAARDDAQQQLRNIKERLQNLALMLGEPQTALLMRHLSRDGTCGACMVPALINPVEPAAGRPPALPAARPAPLGEEQGPCVRLPQPPDDREHICHRWVGGSHTLVTDAGRRAQAESVQPGVPTNRYTGFGTDGKMYLLEEELAPCMPCLECDRKAGDTGHSVSEKPPEGVVPSSKYRRRFDNLLPGEVPSLDDHGAGDIGVRSQL